ncbi:MAG: phytanoyl-CoA dioxygenase family protein [Bdellovibrionales bacterium]
MQQLKPQSGTPDYVSAYQDNGVVVIPGVFSVPEINLLRSAAFMALTQIQKISAAGYKHGALEEVRHKNSPIPSTSPALLFWGALVNPVLDAFRTDRRLREIVTNLLGPDVKQLNNQMYYRLPGDGDSFAWHQDIMFRTPLAEYPGIIENDAYLQTAIVVDRISKENGGIEFVYGSHKLGNLNLIEYPRDTRNLRGFSRDGSATPFAHLISDVVEANPGDVMVWSSLTVHGSESNTSQQHRMYYMNGFAAAAHCQPWPWYTKDGILQPLDASLIP